MTGGQVMTAVAANPVAGIGTILVTIIIGMVLAVVPLPGDVPPEIGFLRPDWVAMIVIYWVIALPQRVGMLSAWVTGIAMDILLGSLIGQHALSYVILAYITFSLPGFEELIPANHGDFISELSTAK